MPPFVKLNLREAVCRVARRFSVDSDRLGGMHGCVFNAFTVKNPRLHSVHASILALCLTKKCFLHSALLANVTLHCEHRLLWKSFSVMLLCCRENLNDFVCAPDVCLSNANFVANPFSHSTQISISVLCSTRKWMLISVRSPKFCLQCRHRFLLNCFTTRALCVDDSFEIDISVGCAVDDVTRGLGLPCASA